MRHLISIPVLLVLAAPVAARDCPDLRATLQDYRIQQHGQSYLKGRLALPHVSDSEHCEKLRRDLDVHRCRWFEARGVAILPHVKRTDPGRYKLALVTMKTQRVRGLGVIATLKDRGCRVPKPPGSR